MLPAANMNLSVRLNLLMLAGASIVAESSADENDLEAVVISPSEYL